MGFQWKMSFNPDPNKQAQDVIFERNLQRNLLILRYFLMIALSHEFRIKINLGIFLDA